MFKINENKTLKNSKVSEFLVLNHSKFPTQLHNQSLDKPILFHN